jgi:uncharacterized protein (DUF433 family)
LETLPARARALLTLLDNSQSGAAATCDELAERWPTLEKLPLQEAVAFADDIEKGRRSLPALKSAWD